MTDPTSLQQAYAAMKSNYIGRMVTPALINQFRDDFLQLLSTYHLDDLKYAFRHPASEQTTLNVIPLTTASEIVLMYMEGLL